MTKTADFTLDVLQEYFWACEPTRTRQMLLAAELSGMIGEEAWRDALCAVASRHPFLLNRVAKLPGCRPFLCREDGGAIPMSYIAKETIGDTAAAMQIALRRGFGYAREPLIRISVEEASDQTLVVLAMHHSVADGLTSAKIMLDLIDAANRKTWSSSEEGHPPLWQLLACPAPQPYQAASGRGEILPASRIPDAHVELSTLSSSDLTSCVARAREESSSFHTALATALSLASLDLAGEGDEGPSRVILTPIDLRGLLGIPGASGFYISSHVDVQSDVSSHFWAQARSRKEALARSSTLEAARGGLLALRDAFPFEADPALWNSIDPKHVLDFDMMISNYGRVQSKESGQLALKALYPACVAGQNQTQTVMLATVDEIVHLSHISREPQKGLVGRALDLLREAVNG